MKLTIPDVVTQTKENIPVAIQEFKILHTTIFPMGFWVLANIQHREKKNGCFFTQFLCAMSRGLSQRFWARGFPFEYVYN